MKRTKFILLALVVALILMGAGYAAWTQTFTINSTVQAGELFVKVSNADADNKLYVDRAQTGYQLVGVNDNPYMNKDTGNNDAADLVKVTQSNKTSGNGTVTLSDVTYNFSKIYPGTKLESTIHFENIGTMPVNTACTISGNSGADIWKNIKITISGGALQTAVVVDGASAASYDAMKDSIKTALTSAVGNLNPSTNGSLVRNVTIVQEFPKAADSNNEAQNESMNWNAVFTFSQYNQ
jgi:hypothetical protein